MAGMKCPRCGRLTYSKKWGQCSARDCHLYGGVLPVPKVPKAPRPRKPARRRAVSA